MSAAGLCRPEDDPRQRRLLQHARLRQGPGRRRGERQRGQRYLPGRLAGQPGGGQFFRAASRNSIGKWFLGTDLPVLNSSSLTYATASGSLFPSRAFAQRRIPGRVGRLLLHFLAGHDRRQQPAGDREHVRQQRRRHLHRPLLRELRVVADYVTVNSKRWSSPDSRRPWPMPILRKRRQFVALAVDSAGRKGLRRSGTRPARKAAMARTTTARSKAAGWPTSRPGAGPQRQQLQPYRLDAADDDQRPGRTRGGHHRHHQLQRRPTTAWRAGSSGPRLRCDRLQRLHRRSSRSTIPGVWTSRSH